MVFRPHLAVVASLSLIALASAAAAQDKTARGTATAVTDVSVTVKTAQQDMTFDVDGKTVVEAPGAGTRTRAAQAAGTGGIKLTSVIQSGQAVLVTYREFNGRKVATRISRVSTAGSQGSGTTESGAGAAGTVKSVTASLLVLTSNGKDSTFVIDQDTRVIARGAGTATAAAGGRIVITNLVVVGDTVQVSYSPATGAMRATEVRITEKAR